MIPHNVKTLIDFTIGDGCLSFSSNKELPFLSFQHSLKQSAYAIHKKNILNSLGYQTHSYTGSRSDGRTYISVNCKPHSDMKTARKYLYNSKKKTIDKALLRAMDIVSLAYWFMDDGCASTLYKHSNITGTWVYESRFTKSYKLSLGDFSIPEAYLVKRWLKEAFDVESTVALWKQYPNVCVNQIAEKDKFRDLLSPYIIDSMRYKFSYPHTCKGIPYTKIMKETQYKSAVETERDDQDISVLDATVQ